MNGNNSLDMMSNLRVAINTQLLPEGSSGGMVQFTIGLIRALGQLNDGTEEYTLVVPWQNASWLEPYIGTNEQIIPGPKPVQSLLLRLSYRLGRARPIAVALYRIAHRARKYMHTSVRIHGVPTSDGFYEGLKCDVIHFPFQYYAKCEAPIVYNPHDLQHLHYPEFFTPEQIAWREAVYRAGCEASHTIVVASNWVKQDIVRHYGTNPTKIQVIPLAPITDVYREPTGQYMHEVRKRYGVDTPFILYPAMTWAHKNHCRLIEAIALLRARANLKVNLVCTGYQTDFWPTVKAKVAALGLQSQVKFLGMVPPEDLVALYHLSQFVVIPSLFEAASAPLFEAWAEGVPVACSSVTSLPEQAQDAALLFDPLSVDAIAEVVERMSVDEGLLETLRLRGQRRLQDFSWERTARAYRAVYHRAAGHTLSKEDTVLLRWDWMKAPEEKQEVVT